MAGVSNRSSFNRDPAFGREPRKSFERLLRVSLPRPPVEINAALQRNFRAVGKKTRISQCVPRCCAVCIPPCRERSTQGQDCGRKMTEYGSARGGCTVPLAIRIPAVMEMSQAPRSSGSRCPVFLSKFMLGGSDFRFDLRCGDLSTCAGSYSIHVWPKGPDSASIDSIKEPLTAECNRHAPKNAASLPVFGQFMK